MQVYAILAIVVPFAPSTAAFVLPFHQLHHRHAQDIGVPCRYVALSPPVDNSTAASFLDATKTATATTNSATLLLPTDSFHYDLQKALKDYKFAIDPLQRHGKPMILKGDPDGAEKAIRMLQHMVRIGVATEFSFQTVFRALLRRGRMQWYVTTNHGISSSGSSSRARHGGGGAECTCVANELEMLLTELEELVDVHVHPSYQSSSKEENDEDDVPNINAAANNHRITTTTYNMVLEAYANCANSRGNYHYAEKAEDLLGRIMATSSSSSGYINEIDTARSLLYVLRAWVWQQTNRGDSKCARRALDYAMELEQMDNVDTAVLAEAYDLVLEAFSKADGGAIQADSIFRKRIKLDIPTPIADYTNVILAWTKDMKEESIARATTLLQTMAELFLAGKLTGDPEHIAFSSVISAWTHLDQPEKAEELLWLMETDIRPIAKSFKPTVYTYNNVLHAYIKDNAKINLKSVNAVSRIVKYMEDNWKVQQLIKPDSFTYNTLIKAWNMSGNLQTVGQMEQVLDRMEAVLEGGTVSNTNFNTVLNAYAKSKEETAVEDALRLFERMKASKLVEPDTITYTSVLECLSKSSRVDYAANKAIEIFNEIKSIYELTRKESMKPNSRTFSMTILTITKAPDRIVQARELLDQLIALYDESKEPSLRPTAHAYNYVINGAAHASNRKEAFKVAARTYQELREDNEIKPDSYTYAFWFKACNQLLGDSNTDLYAKFIKLSFVQCCKEGLVSREVLNRLRQGHLNYDALSKVLRCDAKNVMRIQVDDLDLSWTRNAGAGSTNRKA